MLHGPNATRVLCSHLPHVHPRQARLDRVEAVVAIGCHHSALSKAVWRAEVNMRIHVRIQLQSKYVEYVLPKHVGAWRGDVFGLENGRDTTNVQGLQPTGSRSKSVFGVKSKKD